MAFNPESHSELAVRDTTIPGFYIVDLVVNGDSRGWFKENYQKEKMEALGLPSFDVVQNNFSFNDETGVTRGLHAEPWDKFISVANGSVFGAWVDLRAGESFGQTLTLEINPGVAVYVPRGVANDYQTLEPKVTYTYLVNEHWSPDAKYTFVNLFDPELGIPWPIDQGSAIISEKDSGHPMLREVTAMEECMDDSKIFIVGANGQLGLALREKYPRAMYADVEELDITNSDSVANFDWSSTSYILNAAAFTNVDGAESESGRRAAWAVNASAVAYLSIAANKNDATLVHISSDYVFDGTQKEHTENEPFSPLSVYGASKAAGDIAASLAQNHYIIRTSWVIGDGNNFVKTMLGLAAKDVSPTVVSDQFGRLTFTSELVRATDHLLTTRPSFGTYNVSNSGDVVSWASITRETFKIAKKDHLTVSDTTTDDYYRGKTGIAPRPLQSSLDLTKIQSSGFTSRDWREELQNYIQKEIRT